MWTVYMATNTVNGKRYFGISGRGLEYRMKRHLSLARVGSRACPRLYDAIRKYGEERFIWQEMLTCLTKNEAMKAEISLIANSKKTQEEYNVSAGGALSTTGLLAHNRRAVICLNDGILYPSARRAAEAYRTDVSEVCKACKGRREQTAGKFFRFASEFSFKTEEDLEREIERIKLERAVFRRRKPERAKKNPAVRDGIDIKGRSAAGPMSRARKVICLDDLLVFDSAGLAGEKYDISRNSIAGVCLGKNWRKAAGGKRFSYLDEWCPNPL